MHIERLYAEHFRNLQPCADQPETLALEWSPHRHFNLIAGDNGQGKTNVLEALCVAATLRSFRTTRLQDCLAFGHKDLTLGLRIVRHGQREDLGLRLENAKKKLMLDGKATPAMTQYLGRLVVVLFAPGDLQLPHAEPLERRRWLDRLVFNHDPAHLGDLRRYEKALLSRNLLLRQARTAPLDPDWLTAYDEVLAQVGMKITQRRQQILQRYVPVLQEAFARIAAPGLTADCQLLQRQPLENEQAMRDALTQHRARDLARAHTTVGPHRDDVELKIGGRLAALHASQGQCRALVLAMKVAEMQSLEADFGEAPVLLMDDISSELDAHRNRALMAFLDDLGGQVFLTTTDAAHIQVAAPRQVWAMAAGILTADAKYERNSPAAAAESGESGEA